MNEEEFCEILKNLSLSLRESTDFMIKIAEGVTTCINILNSKKEFTNGVKIL